MTLPNANLNNFISRIPGPVRTIDPQPVLPRERLFEQLLTELHSIARSRRSVPDRVREMLLRRILLWFDTMETNFPFLDTASALRMTLAAQSKKNLASEAAILSPVLEEGQRIGIFWPSDSGASARALLLATNALLPAGLMAAEIYNRDDVKRTATDVVELLLQGMFRMTLPADIEAGLVRACR